MKTLAIIDYGMSNLRSVSKALEHVATRDWQIAVTQQPEVILRADKVTGRDWQLHDLVTRYAIV